jgi:hypothetical protein
VLALLKQQDPEEAARELQALEKNNQDQTGARYLPEVTKAVQEWRRQAEAKKAISTALTDLDAVRAQKAIEQVSASPLQGQILSIYLDAYAGRFQQASDKAKAIPTESYSDRLKLQALSKQIDQSATKSKDTLKQIDEHLYLPLAAAPVTGDNARPGATGVPVKFLQDYFGLIDQASQLTPLNDRVLDLSFHASLLSRPYSEIEQFGDRLLRAKGTIRIPCLSDDRYFTLVIDERKKVIFTEDDTAHQLVVAHVAIPDGRKVRKSAYHGAPAWYSALQPVNLKFDEITMISQSAQDTDGGLARHSYALQFAPSGLVPTYAFMNLLHGIYGEQAQKKATLNLGQYIVHVVGRADLRTAFVDPAKETKQGTGFNFFLQAYSVVAAAQGRGDLATLTQGISTQLQGEQDRLVAQKLYQAEWAATLSKEVFAYFESDTFNALEKLLDLL